MATQMNFRVLHVCGPVSSDSFNNFDFCEASRPPADDCGTLLVALLAAAFLRLTELMLVLLGFAGRGTQYM